MKVLIDEKKIEEMRKNYEFLRKYVYSCVAIDELGSHVINNYIVIEFCVNGDVNKRELIMYDGVQVLVKFRTHNGDLIVILNNKKGWFTTESEFKLTNHTFTEEEENTIYNVINHICSIIKNNEQQTLKRINELIKSPIPES